MRFDSIRFVAERSLGVRARDSVLVGLPWSTKSRERERERERENEWNGATFSPFLYFSGEGGERETGGTHQKQNGGGAKDDDDDDDDDVRINGRRVVHVCVSISAARVAFFVVAANGFGAFISRVFVSHGHRSPSRTGP